MLSYGVTLEKIAARVYWGKDEFIAERFRAPKVFADGLNIVKVVINY